MSEASFGFHEWRDVFAPGFRMFSPPTNDAHPLRKMIDLVPQTQLLITSAMLEASVTSKLSEVKLFQFLNDRRAVRYLLVEIKNIYDYACPKVVRSDPDPNLKAVHFINDVAVLLHDRITCNLKHIMPPIKTVSFGLEWLQLFGATINFSLFVVSYQFTTGSQRARWIDIYSL